MKKRIESDELPETKRRILDAGVGLMRVRGYNGTSLDDICEAAGVTKGGFFHYFKSKDEIAKAAIAEFAQQRARVFQGAAFRNLADPLDRVFGRLDFAIEAAKSGRMSKGCLIGTLAQELSFTNPELRTACRDSFQRAAEDFEKDLTEAKAAHSPNAAFDPRKLAALYVTIMQGSFILVKAADSSEVMADNFEQLRDHIRMLFGGVRAGAGTKTAKPAGVARN
jgi:TetR/AcrR family transcriptional repressor of nem operon